MKNKIRRTLGKVLASSLIVGITAFSMTAIPAMAAIVGSTDTEAKITFTDSGVLTLESAPNLDFGIQDISSEMQLYKANPVSEPVRVSDLRGTGGGWDVSVSLSPFQTEIGESVLEGARIHMRYPTITPGNGTIAQAPIAELGTIITADNQAVRFMYANQETGQGLWEAVYSEIELEVFPGTAKGGRVHGNLQWTLQDAP